MPKKVECKPPAWTDEDHIAYAWCINHEITIGALAVAPGWYNAGWLIEITINGKKITSPKQYKLFPQLLYQQQPNYQV